MASSLGYGVGSARLQIKQVGNDVVLVNQGPIEYTQEFTVGAGPQRVDSAKGPIALTPTWDGGSLRLNLTDSISRWMYISAHELVIDATSARGTSARWRYART
mmetsp:Transcript_65849/g.153018  ORF Transcript_65849/g.153018 Transcript_65849/m.153018 type:complete len:103 (+) Transcript_65849:153-461(+)